MNDIKSMRITQALKSSVNAYLLTRCHAEIMRKEVDKIAEKILASMKFYGNKYSKRGLAAPDVRFRILKHKDSWLMNDEDSHDYLTFLRDDILKAGFDAPLSEYEPGEPTPEWSYKCPALVAESQLVDTEHLIVRCMAEILGTTFNDLWMGLMCAYHKYKDFLDLCIKLVVNQPDFKNPLTGEKIAA